MSPVKLVFIEHLSPYLTNFLVVVNASGLGLLVFQSWSQIFTELIALMFQSVRKFLNGSLKLLTAEAVTLSSMTNEEARLAESHCSCVCDDSRIISAARPGSHRLIFLIKTGKDTFIADFWFRRQRQPGSWPGSRLDAPAELTPEELSN